MMRLLILFVLSSLWAGAHEMRPAFLGLTETEAGHYEVIWKVPSKSNSLRLSLDVVFADDVEETAEVVSAFTGGAHVKRWRIHREQGLEETEIGISGLQRTMTDVLLRLQYLDGTEFTHRLTPDKPGCTIPTAPGPGQIAWTYFIIGTEHILFGIDHLLFVLALLLIVDGWRKLVGTVTAFTLAHSITLGMAALGFVHVPGPPVEAVIALSIVFVASEIIHGQLGKPGLTARAPWLVAFTFGLLHGFGFAGALSEIGLPQQSVPLALLTFNVGVEAGQLLFVAVILVVAFALRKIKPVWPDWSRRVLPYAIGGLAAFWLIERTMGIVS